MDEYDPDRAESDARAALVKYRSRVEEALELYSWRSNFRAENRLPVVAFSGPSRAGKDTAAALFCAADPRRKYPGSCSMVMLPYLAGILGKEKSTCFEERHQHRYYWRRFCDEFRRHNPTLLVKLVLAAGDVVSGMRARPEVEAVLAAGLVDLHIWVDRSQVIGADATLEYGPDLCDLVLPNNDTLEDLSRRVNRLALALKSGTER